jgi:hypothetical protein
MKNRSALKALIVVLCPALAVGASLPDDEQIRIGTYNTALLPSVWMLGFKLKDAAPALGAFGNDKVARAAAIAERVKASNYDLILFDEAFFPPLKNVLVDQLGKSSPGEPSIFYPTYVASLQGSYSSKALAYADVSPCEILVTLAGIPACSPLVRAITAGVVLGKVAQDSGLMAFAKNGWKLEKPYNKQGGSPYVCSDASADVSSNDYAGPAFGGGFYEFRSYKDACADVDCFASKGVGYLRLRHPVSNRIYNVFFTHTQASYGGESGWPGMDEAHDAVPAMDNWLGKLEIRRKQLETLKELADCVLPPFSNSESIVVAGDLNINGDLRQPIFDPTLAYVPPEKRRKNRYEYDTVFNAEPALWTTPRVTPLITGWFRGELAGTIGVTDAWVKAMAGTRAADPKAGFDRGPTWRDNDQSGLRDPASFERLDYILYRSSNPGGLLDGDSCVQHVTRAYNLDDAPGSEGGLSGYLSGSPPTWKAVRVGAQPTSDHLGLNAEITRTHFFCNPSQAKLLGPVDARGNFVLDRAQGGGSGTLTLGQKGEAHWFRLDQPGTYVVNVNPKYQLPAGPSNGIEYQLYDPTELSMPLGVHEGKVRTASGIPAGCLVNECWGAVPPFRDGVFYIPRAPVYLKVFDTSSGPYPKKYQLGIHRATCKSPEDACIVSPFGGFDPNNQQIFVVEPGATENWLEFTLHRADTDRRQQLSFAVRQPREPGNSRDRHISRIQLMRADGAPQERLVALPATLLPVEDSVPVVRNDPANPAIGAFFEFGLASAAPTTGCANDDTTCLPRLEPFRYPLVSGTSRIFYYEPTSRSVSYYLKVERMPPTASYVPPKSFKYYLDWSHNLQYVFGPSFPRFMTKAGSDAPETLKVLCGETVGGDGTDEMYMQMLLEGDTPDATVMSWGWNEAEATYGVHLRDYFDEGIAADWDAAVLRRTVPGPGKLLSPKRNGDSYADYPVIAFVDNVILKLLEDDSGGGDILRDFKIDARDPERLVPMTLPGTLKRFQVGGEWEGGYYDIIYNQARDFPLQLCKLGAAGECTAPLICNESRTCQRP